MSIIQNKRYSSAGESPSDRAATLSPGELAINLSDRQVWAGDLEGNTVLLATLAFVQTGAPSLPASATGSLWYNNSETSKVLHIWDGADWLEVSSAEEILAAIKEATAAATDFADFQARIAAL